MSDYLALALVAGILALAWLLSGPVWRRCRCGARYCRGCGRAR